MGYNLNSEIIRDALNWRAITKVSTGGNSQTITVNATGSTKNVDWIVQGIRLAYVTTASSLGSTVARIPTVQYLGSTSNILDEIRSGTGQGSSSSRFYLFNAAMPDMTSFRDTNLLTTPLNPMMLAQGQQIRVFDNASASTSDATTLTLNILQRITPSTV